MRFNTLFSCASPLRRTATRRREKIRECFTEVKQVFLLYLCDSLVTLELISLIPLVGPPRTAPLAVKLLDNRLYIYFTAMINKNLSGPRNEKSFIRIFFKEQSFEIKDYIIRTTEHFTYEHIFQN